MNRIATKICHVDGCERSSRAKNMCMTHYERVRKRSILALDTPIRTHTGASFSPLYGLWRSMIRLTTDPRNKDYSGYGARGITVCERWMTFRHFCDDMGSRPDKSTLGRIDVNGNFEPSNCRWVDHSIHAYNRRMNPRNTSGYRGVSPDCGEWCTNIGFHKRLFYVGVFESKEEAAWMYDQWAIALWGDNAITNFDYV